MIAYILKEKKLHSSGGSESWPNKPFTLLHTNNNSPDYFIFYNILTIILYNLHKWENDVTKQIVWNQIGAITKTLSTRVKIWHWTSTKSVIIHAICLVEVILPQLDIDYLFLQPMRSECRVFLVWDCSSKKACFWNFLFKNGGTILIRFSLTKKMFPGLKSRPDTWFFLLDCCSIVTYCTFDLNWPPPNWGQIQRNSCWANQLILWLHWLVLWLN